MESTASSKAKRKGSESSQKKKSSSSNIDHYEKQIHNLNLNNEALTKALDTSHKTIRQQDKLITNLQMKLVSQLPKLIEVQLHSMGKLIQQLVLAFEEMKALLNKDSSNNTLNMPSLPSSSDASKDSDSGSKDSHDEKNFTIVDTGILSNKSSPKTTAKSASKSSRAKPASKKSSPSEFGKIKKETETELAKTSAPSFLNDELMQLPASTSRARPKLTARKRLPSKPVLPIALRIEQSNVESSSDDDEPLINKRRRLKVKLQTPQQFRKNRMARLDDKNKLKKGESNEENTGGDDDAEKNGLAAKENKPSPVALNCNSSEPGTTKKRKSTSKSKKKSASKNGMVVVKQESDISSNGISQNNVEKTESLDQSENSDVKVCDTFNCDVKDVSKRSRSRSSSGSSRISVLENMKILKNQPRVCLTDIFHSSKNIVDPIIKKSFEAYKSCKADKPDVIVIKENSIELNGISSEKSSDDEVIPIDLELECVEEDDVVIIQNHVNEVEPSEKSDFGHALDNFRITPSPDFVHNNKEEISIDTINNMLSKLCDENGSQNMRSEERLVFTYS